MKIEINNLFKVSFILIIVCFYVMTFSGLIFGEDIDISKNKNETGIAIQQALKNYEAEKQSKQDELTAQLNFRLGQATETWLNSAESKRDAELGTFIEQDWDKQPRIYTITPVRYDYYLRGYNYSVIDSDVIKTDSVTSPYKAVVVVKEELYAEKYHHPSTSDIKLYYYTVIYLHTLNFIYKNDEFLPVNSDIKMESMLNEISSEARKQWIK